MTTVLHTGDVHVGLNYPGITPESKFKDICRCLDFVADAAIEKRVDVVIVGGDLFKDSKMMFDRGAEELLAIQNFIYKIRGNDIPMVIYSGTKSHDNVKAYEVLKELNNADGDIEILTTPGIVEFNGVSFVVIPGADRSQIMAKEEYKNLSPREVHALMSSKLTDIAQGLRVKCKPGTPVVLAAHYTHESANAGFDQLAMKHEALLRNDAAIGFDAVFLNHIHIPQQCGENPPMFYSGPIERLNFGDEGITPGFYIHQFGDHGYESSEFIETLARKYTTVEFNNNPDEVQGLINDPKEAASRWQKDVRDAVVRIHINADAEQSKQIDRKAIEKAFYDDGAYFVQEIKIEVERSERSRDKEVTESIGPLDAIAKWGAQQGIEETEIHMLACLTQELLEEVLK